MTKYNALRKLVIASLMSSGNVFRKKGEPINELIVPYLHENRYFLADYLKENQLQEYVTINTESLELTITLTDDLKEIVGKWHINSEKIFMKNFLKSRDLEAIILCITLFGSRQIEGIAFSTTIKKRYLFTLCYTIKNYLNVETIFSKNQVKILDVTQLFLEVIERTSSKESSYIATYLNNKEKTELIASTKIIQSKLGEDINA